MPAKQTPSRPVKSAGHHRGRLFFTGFSMGLADLVPGVSGGTIAFLYGIYEELLYSLKVITGTVPRLLLRGKWRQALHITPFSFLIPLLAGMAVAIFGLVQVITYLLDAHPLYIWSLFFGLIISSAYVVSKRILRWQARHYAVLAAGGAITFLLVGLPALNAEASSLIMFATGIVAISAMLLPGISGSLIMVLLGQYENVINAVSEFNLRLLLAFGLGALGGIAVLSRLLSWLLLRYHNITIAFLIGVMLGSLRKVWPWQLETGHNTFSNYIPDFSWTIVAAIGCMLIGFLAVRQLERFGITKEHDDDIAEN